MAPWSSLFSWLLMIQKGIKHVAVIKKNYLLITFLLFTWLSVSLLSVLSKRVKPPSHVKEFMEFMIMILLFFFFKRDDLSEPSDAVWEGDELASRWALTFILRFRTLLTGPARLLAANGHSFSMEWQKKRLKREKRKKFLLMGWKREKRHFTCSVNLFPEWLLDTFFLDWIWNGDTLELLIRGCWLKKTECDNGLYVLSRGAGRWVLSRKVSASRYQGNKFCDSTLSLLRRRQDTFA